MEVIRGSTGGLLRGWYNISGTRNPEGTAQKAEIVRHSFAEAFKTQLVINITVAGAAIVFSICAWKRHPVTPAQSSEQVPDDTSASPAIAMVQAQSVEGDKSGERDNEVSV